MAASDTPTGFRFTRTIATYLRHVTGQGADRFHRWPRPRGPLPSILVAWTRYPYDPATSGSTPVAMACSAALCVAKAFMPAGVARIQVRGLFATYPLRTLT